MTPPLLMGILNITPDSFSDGGKFLATDAAVKHAEILAEQGADIIDIGGESTRPNAMPVTVEAEISRVIPVIEALQKLRHEKKILLSLDTRNATTMREGIKAGIDIINDVSALTHNAESLKVAADSHAQIVLMHMQGTPQTMQNAPHYDDVVREVYAFLEERISACVEAGINKSRLMIDPGIGFGKTPEQNILLLQNIPAFKKLGVRVLIGASRKNFIQHFSFPCPPEERLGGSVAVALYAAQHGADILRLHDVMETKQALLLSVALKAN